MMKPSVLRRGKPIFVAVPVMLALGLVLFTGCPRNLEYEQGFADGFAEDEWYDEGYLDSWESEGFDTFYQGDLIPNPQFPPYERGYWDGVWTAYHDGYFDAYVDAFDIGFEDGYLAGFASPELLLVDEHIEYGTGGFDDGYNDGYSEGIVFGAHDREELELENPDWEGALADYIDGIDVCVFGVCTGEIPLYEWGTNPLLKSAEKRLERDDAPTLRNNSRAGEERGQTTES